MPSKYITINEWIAVQLDQSDKTKYWLAKQIGCSPSHIDNLLNDCDPSQTLIAKLIKAFAVANQTTEHRTKDDWWKSCHGG